MSPPKLPKDDFSDLTLKQRKLVDEYIVLGNKEKAAINAGYSAKSAYCFAYRELGKVRVKEYYQHQMNKLKEKSEENIAKVLKQLHDIAECDMRDFVDKDGVIKDLSKVDGRLIQSIKPNRFGIGLTLTSKERALEMLGKYYSMWTDQIDITTRGESVNNQVNITFQEVTKESLKEEKNGKTKTNPSGKTSDK
jgi:phage terminase small subunit